MSTPLRYPLSDALDRASITLLKVLYVGEENQFEQLMALLKEIRAYIDEDPNSGLLIIEAFKNLFEVNASIWSLESNLRQGQLGTYPKEELKELSQEDLLNLAAIGKAAVQIRETNRKRKSVMNQVSTTFGAIWKDIKINHASE